MKFLKTCFWAIGGWFTWAAVAGAAVSVVGSAVVSNNSKKGAPAQTGYAPIDPQQSQKDAIQGNLSNESNIEDLLNQSNKFQQSQALSLMNQAMPGYSSLAKNLTGLATNLSANPYALPADVQQNLARQSAEMGVSTGRQGQAAQFSVLRDLGVNELQYGQQNIAAAQGLTGLLSTIAPKVNPMSPMSFYVTPQQDIEAQQANNGVAIGQNNANVAARNANATSSAGMWGSLSGSLGQLVGSGQLNGLFSSSGGASAGSGGVDSAGSIGASAGAGAI